MTQMIKDGAGKSYLAKVDSNNMLHTHAYTEGFKEYVLQTTQKAFNINTGKISLTSANSSMLLYIENTGENDIVIPAFYYLFGNSTGGSGDTEVSVYKNGTAGTLITAETDVEMNSSRNTDSSLTPVANLYKGAEGSTCTGGVKLISSLVNSPARVAIQVGDIVLGPNDNIYVEVIPATGNTSQNVMMAVQAWERP
jgi:hypothetical protein